LPSFWAVTGNAKIVMNKYTKKNIFEFIAFDNLIIFAAFSVQKYNY